MGDIWSVGKGADRGKIDRPAGTVTTDSFSGIRQMAPLLRELETPNRIGSEFPTVRLRGVLDSAHRRLMRVPVRNDPAKRLIAAHEIEVASLGGLEGNPQLFRERLSELGCELRASAPFETAGISKDLYVFGKQVVSLGNRLSHPEGTNNEELFKLLRDMERRAYTISEHFSTKNSKVSEIAQALLSTNSDDNRKAILEQVACADFGITAVVLAVLYAAAKLGVAASPYETVAGSALSAVELGAGILKRRQHEIDEKEYLLASRRLADDVIAIRSRSFLKPAMREVKRLSIALAHHYRYDNHIETPSHKDAILRCISHSDELVKSLKYSYFGYSERTLSLARGLLANLHVVIYGLESQSGVLIYN